MGDTREFERVVVVEGGRVVEEGNPALLVQTTGSKYRALLEAEDAVRTGLWSSKEWCRLRLERGQLTENGGEEQG